MDVKVTLVLLSLMCIGRIVDAGYRYGFYDQRLSFDAAERYCSDLSGHLAGPQDTNQRLAFQTELQKSSVRDNLVWLGGKTVDDGQAGIGLQNLNKGTRIWRWVSAEGNDFLLGQGCYKDDWSSELGRKVSLSDVTVPNCVAKCDSMGRMYAALKMGKDCYCSNTYGTKGPIATNTDIDNENENDACDQKCAANTNTHFYCGSQSEDVYNLYKVGGRDTIWFRNSPNNDGTANQQCGTIIQKWPNDPYKLDDLECYDNQPYICTGVSENACASINGEYKTTQPSNIAYCFVFGQFSKTWYRARDICMDIGGDLATIETENEFQYLSKVINALSNRQNTYWVGAVAHEWKWTSGAYVTVTNWADDYPRNLKDGPKCIMADEFMDWKDQNCDEPLMFACQFDTDECSSNPCGSQGSCTNRLGSYECNCNTGYTFDGTTCSDYNECSASSNPCGSNSVCTNSVGSYICSCQNGYVRSGSSCVQAFDECATGSDNCDTNAICTDLDVGFSCTCNTGYSGDGVTCTATNGGTNGGSNGGTGSNTGGGTETDPGTGGTGEGDGGIAPGNAGASTNDDGSTGLGTAEIVLIVLCVLLLIVIIALIAFICYYKRKNSLKNKVKGDNTYDAREEAPVPYAGHLGDDYYAASNYYSGSDNGSTTGLVPAKNSRAGLGLHQGNSSNHYGNQKITLDEKY